MQQGRQATPKLLRKVNNLSSPALLKDKNHLPSRYALDNKHNNPNIQTLLNSIEINAKEEPKITPSSPLKTGPTKNRKLELLKKNQLSEFKPKPLKRQESDMQNFKQIFLEPRQQVLTLIQEKSKSEQVVYAKQVRKDYERLLQFQKGTNGSPTQDKNEQIQQSEVRNYYDQAISLLEHDTKQTLVKAQSNFYEQQIRVEPPDMPNSSIASTVSPGSGYAPSVPLLPSKKGTLTELLMRAKAGMSTQDIQKQAHLAFYLGMVYEDKGAFRSAVKFYKRFLGFAKAMEDKIGMSLGANRVAVNLFYDGQIEKSIAFHHQNLKLSDDQNCFAAYYNLGICHRVKGQYEQSLSFLQTGLQWARQKGQAQSECITLGQIAVTHRAMQFYQKSLQNFQKSTQICRRLKKTSLLQQNLLQMLLIISNFELSSPEKLAQISSEAYNCAKILQQQRSQEIFACNIGIINGGQDFANRMNNDFMPDEIEPCQLTNEDNQQQPAYDHIKQDETEQLQELARSL